MWINNIKKIKKYSNESFWVAFDQIGTVIGSIISIKIMTNILFQREFGYLSLANTIVLFITSGLFGPIGQSFMRFWSIAKETREINNFYALINLSLKVVLLITFSGMMLTCIFMYIFRTSDLKWLVLIILSLLYATCSGWVTIRTYVLTAARERKIVALIHVGGIFLRILAAAIFVIMFGRRASIAMLGNFVASIALLVLTENYFNHFMNKNNSFPLQLRESEGLTRLPSKNIFSMAALFLIWSFFSWIKLSTDKWALQSFYGPETVASFTVVLQLATFPIILMSGFLTSLFNPIAFQLAGNLNNYRSSSKAYILMNKMLFLYALGAIILIVAFYLFHKPLTLFISNKKYANFSSFLPIITFGIALYQFGEILSSFGVLFDRLQVFLIPKIITSLITAISMFLFSKMFGPKGVVWGLNLAAALYTPWCIKVTLKLLKEKMKPL